MLTTRTSNVGYHEGYSSKGKRGAAMLTLPHVVILSLFVYHVIAHRLRQYPFAPVGCLRYGEVHFARVSAEDLCFYTVS